MQRNLDGSKDSGNASKLGRAIGPAGVPDVRRRQPSMWQHWPMALASAVGVYFFGGIAASYWIPKLLGLPEFAPASVEFVRIVTISAAILAFFSALRYFHRRNLARLERQLLEALVRSTCVCCGYNLTGNVSGRCPECGTPIAAGTDAAAPPGPAEVKKTE